ncbi:MAG TPA: M56 family metallopeptidase [Pirellulales bacterium]|nr:M56 family metallopeptidase [Pirellulales bacterium]
MSLAMLGLGEWASSLADVGAKSLGLLLTTLVVDRLFLRRRLLAADAVWHATLLVLLLLPLASVLAPAEAGWQIALIPARPAQANGPPAPAPPLLAGDARAQREASERGSDRAAATSAVGRDRAGGIIVAVYLGVAVLLALRLIAGYVSATRLIGAAERFDSTLWSSRLALHRQTLGIHRQVVLRSSDGVLVPATVGWRHPCILLPRNLGSASDDTTIDAILLHELTHIVRRDFSAHLGWKLCQALYWWNPLVWRAARRAAEIRESIADGYCVAVLGAPEAYAKLLLETAKRLAARRVPAFAVAMARQPRLARRLELLFSLSVDTPLASRRCRLVMLAAGCGLLVVATIVHGVELAPPGSTKPGAAAAIASTAAESRAAEIPPRSSASDMAPAELLYLAWQPIRQAGAAPSATPPAYWDRSGKPLSLRQSVELFKETGRFDVVRPPGDDLNLLLLVFKLDPRLTLAPIMVGIVADGRTIYAGAFARSAPTHGLNVSTLSPPKATFDHWPKQIAIEYTYPIEDPQVIHQITAVPDGPVPVDDGVTWYLDPKRALERGRPKLAELVRANGKTAAVLQTPRSSDDSLPLDSYLARVFLKNGKELSGVYSTIIGAAAEKMHTIQVSEAFAGKDDIARVEFQRQRFRRVTLTDVPLLLDLMPADNP